MKFHKISVLPLFSLILILNTPSLYAHNEEFLDSEPAPACVSVADDPDGDGHGWSPHLFGGHSCVVTDETRPYPLYVYWSGRTTYIKQIRNYWDPNVDFVNREIKCANYAWSDELGNYEKEDVFYITHYPLSDSEPSMGEYEIRVAISDTESHLGAGVWQSTDGRYVSESYYVTPDKPIKMFADPWGEVIKFSDKEGMRFFYRHLELQADEDVIDGSEFQECTYTSADSFLPSGNWDESPTEPRIVTVQLPRVIVDIQPVKPEIINPATGEQVELQALSWNPQEDLFQQQIWCTDYHWNTDSFQSTYQEADGYLFMPPRSGGNRGNVYVNGRGQGITTQHEWFIEDGQFKTTSLFPTEGWYETVADGQEDIRVWTQNSYDACLLDGEAAEQKLLPSGETREASEQTSAVDTVQPVSQSENGGVQTASNGGGSISLFFLVLLVCRCRGRQVAKQIQGQAH